MNRLSKQLLLLSITRIIGFMLICTVLAYSCGPLADVDNILPARRVLQPNLQEACGMSEISSPVTAVKDIMTTGDQKNDMQRMYKNQLQNYAQKRKLTLPVYSSEWEGPPHAIRFKGKVTIDGHTYESPDFFSTMKDAEHAAAKVALMSLSTSGAQEDDTGLYKNLLQELVQNEGFRLPVYSTYISGKIHMPIFVSNVEIEGEVFAGHEAKTKKQAEMSAAKAAYATLKERKGKSDQSSLFLFSAHRGQAPQFSSPSSESKVTAGLQHANLRSTARCSCGLVTENQPEVVKGSKRSSSSEITNGFEDPNRKKNKGCEEHASLSNDQSSLSNCANMDKDSSYMPPKAVSTSARRKDNVFSRQTNVNVAEGGTYGH